MTNRYEESLGIWEHKIGNVIHRLEPDQLDTLELAKLMSKYTRDKAKLMQEVGSFYERLVLKYDKTLTEEEKTSLTKFITKNFPIIFTDTLLAFRWIKPEDLEELKQERDKLFEDSDEKKNPE